MPPIVIVLISWNVESGDILPARAMNVIVSRIVLEKRLVLHLYLGRYAPN